MHSILLPEPQKKQQSMNIINAFLLNFFLKPAGIYNRMGVDIIKLKSLLTCKLIMDDRQPFSFGQSRQKGTDEPVNNSTWLALGIYLLMGLLFIFFFFIGNSPSLHFTAFFSMYIVMLTLSLIIDFTRVLIDVRDNFIILPKPVNDRTFLIARILHIAIHLSKMVIPLSLPSAIVVLVQHSIGGFAAFLFSTFFATLFSILLINATYLFILHFSKPEKFKSIINYLQIGFTILIYGGYQLIPRIFSKTMLENLDLNSIILMNAIPSYWFAALWQMLTGPAWNTNLLIGTFLAISMPVLGIYLVVKVFAPAFNQKLSLIGGSAITEKPFGHTGKVNPSWGNKISQWITKPGTERMGFDFSWRMMLRSREFKMQVYPGIGYMIVLLIVFSIQGNWFHTDSFQISNPDNRFKILAILYSPSLLMMAASSTMHLSPSWKASWIYQMSPTQKPGHILNGSIKAVIAQFMALFWLLSGVLGCVFNGVAFLPVWITAVTLQIVLTYLISIIFSEFLPFSQPLVKSGSDGTSVGMGMIAIILIGVLVFLHWLIFPYQWMMISAIIGAIVLIWLMQKQILSKQWKNIRFAKEMS
jgi:hypothetical protein